MKLYEIDARLEELLENGFDESCVDAETGEIYTDKVAGLVESLGLAREQKIEGIALYIKELGVEEDAIRAEEIKLRARRERKTAKRQSLSDFLSLYLRLKGYPKFETAKTVLSFRKSESVEIEDESAIPAEFKRESVEVKIDKQALKKAIKSGQAVKGARLEEHNNLQIK